MKRHSFDHRGLRLSYLDSGRGPDETVLLLHGFPDDAHLWDVVAEDLVARGYRVIAPDTIGCGESEASSRTADYAIRHIVSDHLALLDRLGLDAVHLAGHDWGSLIAWFFTIEHAMRVRSLTAVSVGHPTAFVRHGVDLRRAAIFLGLLASGHRSAPVLLSSESRPLARLLASHPAAMEALVRLRAPDRLGSALRIYQANLLRIITRRHPRVGVPALGVWGVGDEFVLERQMRRTSAHVGADWTYMRLEGGHWVPSSNPSVLAEAMAAHMRRATQS